MNLLIIGAGRGIGFELLRQALNLGHHVTALVRDTTKLTFQHEDLRVVRGGALDPRAVSDALSGQADAACWTVGIRPTRKVVTLFSEGTRILLAAMKEAGQRRLVCVTGIGAGDSRGHGGFLYDRIIQPLLLKTIYEDKDRQEALIQASDTDWTIVRPGFLTNGPLTGRYRVLTDLSGATAGKISRADVANFMLESLASRQFLRQTVLLTY